MYMKLIQALKWCTYFALSSKQLKSQNWKRKKGTWAWVSCILIFQVFAPPPTYLYSEEYTDESSDEEDGASKQSTIETAPARCVAHV